MSPSTKTPVAPPAALVAALRKTLRPVVKLMLAHGITYPFVAELLKGVFIDVADRDFQIGGRPQTDSRINLLSGVHRKDVRRLRRETPEAGAAPPAVSLGAQLVAAWTTLHPFAGRGGRPRTLARLASAGGKASFENLVASVSKDIRSRAVLDEWLRLGVVHLDEKDQVVLNVDAFIPERGFDEKVFYLGHNLHDHAAAATHNVLGGKPPFLERSVHYDALTAESITHIAQLAEQTGMQAVKAVNREAMRLENRDSKRGEARERFTFGIYFYSSMAPGAPADGD